MIKMVQLKSGRGRKVSTAAMTSLLAAVLFLGGSSMVFDVDAFHRVSMPSWMSVSSPLHYGAKDNYSPVSLHEQQQKQKQRIEHFSRRSWLSRTPEALVIAAIAVTGGTTVGGWPEAASASDLGEVTDKVFVDVSGLSASASAETGKTQRIVLGLFGKDAPSSVKNLKLLHDTSKEGLQAACKPLKEDFLIQREQLEANKIYRSCVEGVDKGVTYDYAQIWRIVKDERIDFGSLSGKFNAREYPTWAEKSYPNASDYLLSSASKYLMAVRKGSDSGFGYTLFPVATARANQDFLENYLVVGRVLEGEEIVDQINNVSVVASSKSLNYMSIVGGGGGSKTNAPKKDCRYGGPMYCNENKPLTKLTMFRTGIM
jgi:cyclophilin family peptidyl-prolyl cis-trans isomerase